MLNAAFLTLWAALVANVVQLTRGSRPRACARSFALTCIAMLAATVLIIAAGHELAVARDAARIVPPCVLEGGPLSPWPPH